MRNGDGGRNGWMIVSIHVRFLSGQTVRPIVYPVSIASTKKRNELASSMKPESAIWLDDHRSFIAERDHQYYRDHGAARFFLLSVFFSSASVSCHLRCV